jgi:hypothetical protein
MRLEIKGMLFIAASGRLSITVALGSPACNVTHVIGRICKALRPLGILRGTEAVQREYPFGRLLTFLRLKLFLAVCAV